GKRRLEVWRSTRGRVHAWEHSSARSVLLSFCPTLPPDPPAMIPPTNFQRMRIGSSDPESQLRLRLAAIVALAAVLRVIFLGARSFWNDEIVSVNLAAAPWQGFTFWVLR